MTDIYSRKKKHTHKVAHSRSRRPSLQLRKSRLLCETPGQMFGLLRTSSVWSRPSEFVTL